MPVESSICSLLSVISVLTSGSPGSYRVMDYVITWLPATIRFDIDFPCSVNHHLHSYTSYSLYALLRLHRSSRVLIMSSSRSPGPLPVTGPPLVTRSSSGRPVFRSSHGTILYALCSPFISSISFRPLAPGSFPGRSGSHHSRLILVHRHHYAIELDRVLFRLSGLCIFSSSVSTLYHFFHHLPSRLCLLLQDLALSSHPTFGLCFVPHPYATLLSLFILT